jgi:hypothetical protein
VRLGYRFLIAGILLSFISSVSLPASATGWLQLAPDANGNLCEVADPGPNGFVTIYVVAKNYGGVAGFHFSAPVPPNSGLIHVSDQSAFYPVGGSQGTVDVALGTCELGNFVVMQMQFYRANQGQSCVFYGAAAGASYMDCSFGEWPAQVVGTMVNSDGTCSQARNVSPANGATDVPLTTTLSWQPGYTCFIGTSPTVFFGTNPNPPQAAYDVQNPYQIGPLQPGTKYYWKIADPGAGPTWTFTTTNSVATRPSTWGSIKALYR